MSVHSAFMCASFILKYAALRHAMRMLCFNVWQHLRQRKVSTLASRTNVSQTQLRTLAIQLS